MHGERRSSQIDQDPIQYPYTSHKRKDCLDQQTFPDEEGAIFCGTLTLEPYTPLSRTYAQGSGCNHQAVWELRKAGLMPPLRPRRKPRR